MKYRIWQHIDSGIELEVEAESEKEAIDKAEELLLNCPHEDQILLNAQAGSIEEVEEV